MFYQIDEFYQHKILDGLKYPLKKCFYIVLCFVTKFMRKISAVFIATTYRKISFLSALSELKNFSCTLNELKHWYKRGKLKP